MASGWRYPNAVTQLSFFRSLFDNPATYAAAAGGQATWTAAQLSSKTFLQHPAPFTSLVVADTPTPITVTITVFLNDTQALNITRSNIQIAYNAAQHQLIVQAVAAVDLVASMLIAQRVQSGQISWNTAAGYLLNMRQNIVNSSGFLDINKVSDAYGQWYSMWSSGMPQVASMSPIERMSLGMRTPAPTTYDRATPTRDSSVSSASLSSMFNERMARAPTLAQVAAAPRSQQLNGMFGRAENMAAYHPPVTTVLMAPTTNTSRLANTFTPPPPPSQTNYGIPNLFHAEHMRQAPTLAQVAAAPRSQQLNGMFGRAEHAAVPRHPMQHHTGNQSEHVVSRSGQAVNRNPHYGSSTRGSEYMTMSQLRANNTPRECMTSSCNPVAEQMTVAELRRRELMRTNTVASLFNRQSEHLSGVANLASGQLQYSRMGGDPTSLLYSSNR